MTRLDRLRKRLRDDLNFDYRFRPGRQRTPLSQEHNLWLYWVEPGAAFGEPCSTCLLDLQFNYIPERP